MLFYEYEIPSDRTPESFSFKVEEVWAGRAVEEYWTDERAEVDRIIGLRDETQYDVRVIPRSGGAEYYKPTSIQ